MESLGGLQQEWMQKHCSAQTLNNMKLKIGKLYKLNRAKPFTENSGIWSTYYTNVVEKGSVVLLLEIENIGYLNSFKILNQDGIMGWITNGGDETLFSTNIE